MSLCCLHWSFFSLSLFHSRYPPGKRPRDEYGEPIICYCEPVLSHEQESCARVRPMRLLRKTGPRPRVLVFLGKYRERRGGFRSAGVSYSPTSHPSSSPAPLKITTSSLAALHMKKKCTCTLASGLQRVPVCLIYTDMAGWSPGSQTLSTREDMRPRGVPVTCDAPACPSLRNQFLVNDSHARAVFVFFFLFPPQPHPKASNRCLDHHLHLTPLVLHGRPGDESQGPPIKHPFVPVGREPSETPRAGREYICASV